MANHEALSLKHTSVLSGSQWSFIQHLLCITQEPAVNIVRRCDLDSSFPRASALPQITLLRIQKCVCTHILPLKSVIHNSLNSIYLSFQSNYNFKIKNKFITFSNCEKCTKKMNKFLTNDKGSLCIQTVTTVHKMT